ncbi:2-C-methyl-D-erythritol 4-phosphate cytidylyltransferase [Shewanella sp. NIFS-20-20]|uniref:2-C-methyl-D-erythritol 4-phosphate cytidylyltransferase n=1 Tax=Shewanella sp. NIFS-20-20 TaxID=2853806 RepID=UPI001C43BEDC|nr:2-C-methyl-D-erythritol 4-phosphate cytidylyltransferase [Shewanella sp. NIFS-20-20]MBV7316725.1 2-C-methyl-D-erythritol 4-phosphate cytidylyltransferase [Shewanella sp. NIFS-20-20]
MSQVEPRLGRVIAVVPAAGIGSRMGASMAKQYLVLGQQTILAHTLDILLNHPEIAQVVVALHPQDQLFAQLPQSKHPKVTTVIGGGERADSVLAALEHITTEHQGDDVWVMVHDAARPCVRVADIDKLLASRDSYPQGALLAAPVRDTMKRASADGTVATTVCRESLWHALTPQIFNAQQLKKHLAMALAAHVAVTDEASAMEWAGMQPGLVQGHSDNIKITHPDDLPLAGLLLSSQGR